jgi:hypothetical protein
MVASGFPAALATLPCRGRFEAHLTVEADTADRREALVRLCDALGVGCVMIELARGAHPIQPMTSSHHAGELASVLAEIAELHHQLAAAGFAVVRIKLEADPDALEVSGELPGGYFEYHAKLRLPAESDLEALRATCVAEGAHLSRNAREREPAGTTTRFVTLRVDAAREVADARCAALVERLAAAGHQVAAVKAEYTLYDTRLELDAGWLDAEAR